MSSKLIHIIFFVTALFITANSYPTSISSASIESIVNKVCTAKYQECCLERIQFQKPLNCSTDKHENIVMAQQIEQKMFPGQKILLSVRHCCDFFNNTHQDPSNQCFNQCHSTVFTPSISYLKKIEKIKCTIPESPIYSKCYMKCVNRLEVDHSCHYELKMKPNEHYIAAVEGLELEDKK